MQAITRLLMRELKAEESKKIETHFYKLICENYKKNYSADTSKLGSSFEMD